MRLVGQTLSLAATDLANFLGCRHRSALDKAATLGLRPYPPRRDDPLLKVLAQRGEEHEAAYVALLESQGRRIVNLRHPDDRTTDRDELVARTRDAMASGADVIVQGALTDGRWFGYADVLELVNRPSSLGSWSYEVTDTKLSRHTRGGTILQLAVYAALLESMQGRSPEHFHVVIPGTDGGPPVKQSYRVDSFAAYFRLVREHMLRDIELDPDRIAELYYPEPVEHCDVCPWWMTCDDRRRADDHLSLVANLTRLHRRELTAQGIETLTGLATMPVPITFKPKRGSAQTYAHAREQAKVQLESRGRTPPLYRLRPVEPHKGLCRLPEPSPGDVFLDLEGDPFASEGGREYLFGIATIDRAGKPCYRHWWALDAAAERSAFEQVVDFMIDRLANDPGMHVYHYAPYEPAALKRLMGRYATRAEELDQLLRGERFVDLFAVARQAMFAGVERYSIKNLEPLYGFNRVADLRAAGEARAALEQALELHRIDTIPSEVFRTVEEYNRDDCLSTLALRNWLETLRAHLEATGTPVPRTGVAPQESRPESEASRMRRERAEALRARLHEGIDDIPVERSPEQARWLLGHMLEFHRREEKAAWWEYFRLRNLAEEDLPDEPKAIAELRFVERLGPVVSERTGRPTRSVIDRYTYPPQEMEIGRGAVLKTAEGTWGEVVGLDRVARTIDVRKGPSRAELHPSVVFEHAFVSAAPMEEALVRLAQRVAEEGIEALDDTPAGDLLLARPPRLRTGTFAQRPGESKTDFAMRIVGDLDDTLLAIQGPPGSGKTYTGARMICTLVKAGKKVGVTANSHKVIRNLLDAVHEAAVELGVSVRLAHRVNADDATDDEMPHRATPVVEIGDNNEALDRLAAGEIDVLGATAWLWSRPEAAHAVHVLFVDEAGQMALANTLAVSQAASSMVLLGDPRQLEQPRQASHPEGVGTSALQHLLGSARTLADDQGIFLDHTWRLAPAICRFTSEVFYASRLESRPELAQQVLRGAGDFDGSGLWVVEVEHDGNRSAAAEEVDAVVDLVRRLTSGGITWVDATGRSRPLTGSDILVVAPYNAQVSRLAEALEGSGAQAGTVDKFQGQERPVVIYSMATSRPEDAPRGMEFLYSLNRLNVATSRARCAAILVASPRLFEPECRNPRQMMLANAVCRYRELARCITNLREGAAA